jgi:hypothetical protein
MANKKRNEGNTLHIGRKVGTQKPERNVIIDDYDLYMGKRTGTDFLFKKKIVPACMELPTIETTHFPWGTGV